MKDKWINIGYEGEELKPYTEPEEDFGDTKRIGEGQRVRAQLLSSEVLGHRAREGPRSPTLHGCISDLARQRESEGLVQSLCRCFLAVRPGQVASLLSTSLLV